MDFVANLGQKNAAMPRMGFNFDLVKRNEYLTKAGLESPTAMSTGTTIVGVIFDGGLVLGADTRATAGSIVADKNCEKIHFIAPNIYCCGAGTAADTEKTTGAPNGLVRAQSGLAGRHHLWATVPAQDGEWTAVTRVHCQ